MSQQKIDSEIHKLKLWYAQYDPFCIFCSHGVTEFDMCHLIRRSDSVPGMTRYQLQTMKLNVWPGHRDCHDIYDNDMHGAARLPGINKVIDCIGKISLPHQRLILERMAPYWPEFQFANHELSDEELLYMKLVTKCNSQNVT